ncbi:MAG: hypothetical protein M1838_002283 [Thelocarpon superellum]|nr:MAG: hypothetical protein M1838_002283 [Thelocarpon superellum]
MKKAIRRSLTPGDRPNFRTSLYEDTYPGNPPEIGDFPVKGNAVLPEHMRRQPYKTDREKMILANRAKYAQNARPTKVPSPSQRAAAAAASNPTSAPGTEDVEAERGRRGAPLAGAKSPVRRKESIVAVDMPRARATSTPSDPTNNLPRMTTPPSIPRGLDAGSSLVPEPLQPRIVTPTTHSALTADMSIPSTPTQHRPFATSRLYLSDDDDAPVERSTVVKPTDLPRSERSQPPEAMGPDSELDAHVGAAEPDIGQAISTGPGKVQHSPTPSQLPNSISPQHHAMHSRDSQDKRHSFARKRIGSARSSLDQSRRTSDGSVPYQHDESRSTSALSNGSLQDKTGPAQTVPSTAAANGHGPFPTSNTVESDGAGLEQQTRERTLPNGAVGAFQQPADVDVDVDEHRDIFSSTQPRRTTWASGRGESALDRTTALQQEPEAAKQRESDAEPETRPPQTDRRLAKSHLAAEELSPVTGRNLPTTSSLDDVVDLTSTVDTEVITRQVPAVTHETVYPEVHQIREEVIYREIHTYEVHHRILPIIDVQVLPPRHFIPVYGGLKEVPAEDIPGRQDHWQIVETVTPDYSFTTGTTIPPPNPPSTEPTMVSTRTYQTEEGYPRTETVWKHPPTYEMGARLTGQTWPLPMYSVDPHTLANATPNVAEPPTVTKTIPAALPSVEGSCEPDESREREPIGDPMEVNASERPYSSGTDQRGGLPTTGRNYSAPFKRASLQRKPVNPQATPIFAPRQQPMSPGQASSDEEGPRRKGKGDLSNSSGSSDSLYSQRESTDGGMAGRSSALTAETYPEEPSVGEGLGGNGKLPRNEKYPPNFSITPAIPEDEVSHASLGHQRQVSTSSLSSSDASGPVRDSRPPSRDYSRMNLPPQDYYPVIGATLHEARTSSVGSRTPETGSVRASREVTSSPVTRDSEGDLAERSFSRHTTVSEPSEARDSMLTTSDSPSSVSGLSNSQGVGDAGTGIGAAPSEVNGASLHNPASETDDNQGLIPVDLSTVGGLSHDETTGLIPVEHSLRDGDSFKTLRSGPRDSVDPRRPRMRDFAKDYIRSIAGTSVASPGRNTVPGSFPGAVSDPAFE